MEILIIVVSYATHVSTGFERPSSWSKRWFNNIFCYALAKLFKCIGGIICKSIYIFSVIVNRFISLPEVHAQ